MRSCLDSIGMKRNFNLVTNFCQFIHRINRPDLVIPINHGYNRSILIDHLFEGSRIHSSKFVHRNLFKFKTKFHLKLPSCFDHGRVFDRAD